MLNFLKLCSKNKWSCVSFDLKHEFFRSILKGDSSVSKCMCEFSHVTILSETLYVDN